MEQDAVIDNNTHDIVDIHPGLADMGSSVVPKQYDVHPDLAVHMEKEPDVQASAQEQPQPQESVPVDHEPVAKIETPQQSFKNLRENQKLLEQELRLKEQELAFYKSQQNSIKTKASDEEYLTDTERKMREDLGRYEAQVRKNNEELQELKRQQAITKAEARLYQEYPDIKEVVSDENIQKLQDLYPNLYNSVIASTDVYTVGSAAYEMIVAKGIHKKSNPLSNIASRNSSKIRSSSTISADSVAPEPGQTPISRASRYMGNSISSEEERQALWKEMVNSSRTRV